MLAWPQCTRLMSLTVVQGIAQGVCVFAQTHEKLEGTLVFIFNFPLNSSSVHFLVLCLALYIIFAVLYFIKSINFRIVNFKNNSRKVRKQRKTVIVSIVSGRGRMLQFVQEASALIYFNFRAWRRSARENLHMIQLHTNDIHMYNV